MKASRLEVTLIPAPDDLPLRDAAYQRQLLDFTQALQSKGFKVSVTIELIEAAGAGGPPTYLGDFSVIIKPAMAALVAVIAAWLHAKRGRKVRLKTKEFDASGQTLDEVKELVKLVAKKRRKNSTAKPRKKTQRPKSDEPTARNRKH